MGDQTLFRRPTTDDQRPAVCQIAVAVLDLDAAAERWSALLGVPAAIEDIPDEGVRVARLELGGLELELIAPTGANSIARFLEKRGEGLHHIGLAVPNLEAAIAAAAASGFPCVRGPAQGRHYRYTFLEPKSANGVLVELMELPSDTP